YDPEDFSGKYYKGKPGFISEYGQENSSEDFSETASAMMTNSGELWKRIETDQKLKRKVTFLQQTMFSNTFGLFNQEYWDLLRRGNLPPDFLKKRKAYLLSLDFNQFQQDLKINNWKNYLFAGGQNVMTEEGVFRLFRKLLAEVEI